MGCIEIGTDYTEKEADGRLIETWDVLKLVQAYYAYSVQGD